MSSVDPTDSPDRVPPALEPARGRLDAHKRSFATSRVILALALREMTQTYGRSPGGYVWAILEPVGMILILSVGFALLMRSPSLGNSFLLFYASGYLPFALYKTLEKATSNSITYSRRLLLYPAVTWLDAIVARFALNLLINVMNMVLILGGILYFTEPGTVLDFPPIILAVTLAAFLGLGIGTVDCVLSGLFTVWSTIWKIAMRPLMIASAILYTYEDLPQQAQAVIWWNPLVHVTGLFRTGVFPTYYPQYISPAYVFGVSFVTLAFGLLFLSAYHSQIINKD